ncbi:hypothetical protein Sjap_020003 [Stephania japonica]|uniref:Alcohol dehydrogenase-like C-terminal domain-containing protein n=1 Tax=Stephania japonica TaxID=461633 RepID=A0AAP0I0B9_9MAGN
MNEELPSILFYLLHVSNVSYGKGIRRTTATSFSPPTMAFSGMEASPMVFGLHVTVINTSSSKEKEAKESLGADSFVLSTDIKQMKEWRKSFDFIIDTVSAVHSLGPILDLLTANGILVVVGEREQQRVVLLGLCGKHNITCDVEVIRPSEINEAMARLASNDVRSQITALDEEVKFNLMDEDSSLCSIKT